MNDHSMTMPLPELKITVFSDYICPFCYLGHHRLQRLRDSYQLKINWCFLEIHPETSKQGDAIDSLQYSDGQWRQMVENLERIAAEENIPLASIHFISNSKDALLLSEASKQCGRDRFYSLHEDLFAAYFVDGKNIADRDILTSIAHHSGIDDDIIESAWNDKRHERRLLENYASARRYDIQSVPSFIFGERVLTGVVAESDFREAAEQMIDAQDR